MKKILVLGNAAAKIGAFALALGLVACDDSTSANSSPGDENLAEDSSSSVIPSEVEGSNSSVVSSSSVESSSSVVSSSSEKSSSSVASSSSVKSSSSVASSSSAKSSSSSVVSSSSSSSTPIEDPSSSSVTSSSSAKSSSSVVSSSSSSSNQIKDPSSSSVASSSSMKVAWAYLNPDIDYGEFVDERDGQVYKTVTIGTQTWMAENLNYAYKGVKFDNGDYTSDSTSWCYDNDPSKCATYGRLYTWAAAMDSAGIVDPSGAGKGCGYSVYCDAASSATKVRGVCPSGWHLPRDAEWKTLYTNVGGTSTAGSLLKSTSGWNDYKGKSGNGTDKYGFSVLPAGYRYNGDFFNRGNYADFWSSTEYEYNSSYAWYQDFYYRGDYVDRDVNNKLNGFSVRCLKD